MADLDWHTVTQDELFQRLGTSAAHGLSSETVQERFAKYGRNAPSPPPTHWFRKIFGYAFGGFGAVLLIGGILVSEIAPVLDFLVF